MFKFFRHKSPINPQPLLILLLRLGYGSLIEGRRQKAEGRRQKVLKGDFIPLKIKRLIEIGDAEGVGGLLLGFQIRDVTPILIQTGVVNGMI